MDKQKKKFRDIFQEDKDEKLKTIVPVKVKGEDYPKDYIFTANDKLGGINFHKYRYLDLAVIPEESGDRLEIVGFFPALNE
ncbi:hypothetical protein N9L18_00520 [Candidatus Pacebacteria bacterium]|nr:hypothetical protein [Candidatus Paceibacterota bacterium]